MLLKAIDWAEEELARQGKSLPEHLILEVPTKDEQRGAVAVFVLRTHCIGSYVDSNNEDSTMCSKQNPDPCRRTIAPVRGKTKL